MVSYIVSIFFLALLVIMGSCAVIILKNHVGIILISEVELLIVDSVKSGVKYVECEMMIN